MISQASADLRESPNFDFELELIYLNRERDRDIETDSGESAGLDDDTHDEFSADGYQNSDPLKNRFHAFQTFLDLSVDYEIMEPVSLVGELQLGIDQGQHVDMESLYLQLDVDGLVATAGQLETVFVDADGAFISASLTEFAEIDGSGARIVFNLGEYSVGSLFVLDPESIDGNSERTRLPDGTIGAALSFGRDRELPALSVGWVNDLTVADERGDPSGEPAFLVRYMRNLSVGLVTLEHVETRVAEPDGGTSRAYGSALEFLFFTEPGLRIGIRGEQTQRLYDSPERRYSLLAEKRLSDTSVIRLETAYSRFDTNTLRSRHVIGIAVSFNLAF